MGLLQALDLAFNDQIFVAAQLYAVLTGKTLRAIRDKIDVGALFQHQTGDSNGIANVLHAAYSAGAQGVSIHHQGIKLHGAIASEKAASSSIEGIVVFHGDDCSFNSVHGGAAPLQQTPPKVEGLANSVEMGLDHVIGNGPGAAMNHQNGSVRQDSTSTGNGNI